MLIRLAPSGVGRTVVGAASRRSALGDRVPASVPGRGGVPGVSVCVALAGGFRCPACGGGEVGAEHRRHLWQCRGCGRQTSVTAGTVMHKTHLPLTLWFWAAYLVGDARAWDLGAAAATPARDLSLRDGLDDPAQAAAGDGRTGARATHGRGRGRRGLPRRPRHRPARRPSAGRQAAWSEWRSRFAATVRGGCGCSCCPTPPRLAHPVRRGSVAAGATSTPTAGRATAGLRAAGFDHRPRNQRARFPDREWVLPRAHRALSNLKTWLQGTHHGVSPQHLQVYLDEFVFRHNRRRTPLAGFQTLLGLGAAHEPTTYHEITRETTKPPRGAKRISMTGCFPRAQRPRYALRRFSSCSRSPALPSSTRRPVEST